jgi:hypothetical protein
VRRGTATNLLNVEYRNQGFTGQNNNNTNQTPGTTQVSTNFKQLSTDTLPTYSFIERNTRREQTSNQEPKY